MNLPKPLISVAVYLRGPDLNPSAVSQALGTEPSKSQKKGTRIYKSRRLLAKSGLWVLKIKSDSRPVENMIDEL